MNIAQFNILLFLVNFIMSNKSLFDTYKVYRIYRTLSIPLIINDMMCNRIMKSQKFVQLSPRIYKWSCRYIGRNFTNFVLQSTYCKIFTAGNSVQQANQASYYFREQGIPVIIDYCAEGDINNPQLQNTLDENAQLFAQSADLISKHKNEMVSIKITGLLDIGLLKQLNQYIVSRNNFWKKFKTQRNTLTYNSLEKGLKEIQSNISQQDIKQYLHVIHNYPKQSPLNNFQISEFNFNINHHPYYLYDQHKNENRIIRLMNKLNLSSNQKLNAFKRRLTSIIDPHHVVYLYQLKNANNFRILVDAEQSYVQLAIQFISEQMQVKYNRQRSYIIPTIQNYLKRSVQRTDHQIMLAKAKNIKFGAKLVRGAYIVQESRLAKQFGYENPVVENFEDTTSNYMRNYEQILTNFTEGQVIVATHNIDTITQALKVKEKYKSIPTVSFAQLLGLADHITCKLNLDGHTVYKYLPWAQTQVMVPYMIRRAQQLNQMKYPLDIQYQLLKHELTQRISFL